jgi:hypothetical protein
MNYTALLIALTLGLTACDKPATPPADVKREDTAPAAEKHDDHAEHGDHAHDAPTTQPGEKAEAPAADPNILGVGATPSDIASDEPHQYGARFTIIEEPMTLATAIGDIDKHTGSVKVVAEVEKVCQAKGCWFTLKAPDVPLPVRVKMEGYAFFLPKNGMGAEAVLEGKLSKTTIDQATAQHYADDEAKASGQPARKVEGPQDTYEFTATAVQLTRKKS